MNTARGGRGGGTRVENCSVGGTDSQAHLMEVDTNEVVAPARKTPAASRGMELRGGSSTGVSGARSGTNAPLSSRMPASIVYFLQRSMWWHFGRPMQDLQRQPPLARRLAITRFPPATPDLVVELTEKMNWSNIAVSLMRKTAGWGSGESVDIEAKTQAFAVNTWICRQPGRRSGQSQTT